MQLYAKYGLAKLEQKFIEPMIMLVDSKGEKHEYVQKQRRI